MFLLLYFRIDALRVSYKRVQNVYLSNYILRFLEFSSVFISPIMVIAAFLPFMSTRYSFLLYVVALDVRQEGP